MSSSGASFVDYYELLGIAPEAEIHEIRKAFLQKAKSEHPDAGGSNETMQQLNLAYKTLMSSTAKAAYDLSHGFHTGITEPSNYKYHNGREVNDVDDMTDDEIDSFLDSLFEEYRHGPPPQPKPTPKQRIKRMFGI